MTASTAKSLDIVPQTAERKKQILKHIKQPQKKTAMTGEDQGEIVSETIEQGDIEEQPGEAPDQRLASAAAMHTSPGQCDICGDKGIA